MKPMIIMPPGLMSQADILKLEKNDICVVVSKDPARVKFVDPIPAASSRSDIENAAIKLSRLLLNPSQWSNPSGDWNAGGIAKSFINFLTQGTPLDSRGTKEEQESSLYDRAKREEIERIAREDARAERAAKKKALLESSLKKPDENKV